MLTKLTPTCQLLLTLFLVVVAAACMQHASAEPDPKNELPFGYVDQPAPGSTVERNVPMRGWALDDGSVKEVRVYVDGRFGARTALNESRPDVSKAYPKYAGGTDMHGWALTLSLGQGASAGPHT